VTAPDRLAEALLRRIGAAPGAPFDLAEAALALAILEEVPVGLDRYRSHLKSLCADVAAVARDAAPAAARAEALAEILVRRFGYRGDQDAYESLANANLIHVIDRRRGLPVALGILFIHVARAQGWPAAGLAFPGHFLIRVDGVDGPVIVDPFHEGRRPDAADLRSLLRAMTGEEAVLTPEHCAPVSDLEILLRLQNNLKLRLVEQGRMREAGFVIDRMLLLAPREFALWRECALIQARIGALDRALAAVDQALEHADTEAARHQMAVMRQRLRGSLH